MGAVGTVATYVTVVGLSVLPGKPLLLVYEFLLTQVFGQLMVGAAPLLKQYFLPAALTFALILSVPSSGGAVTPDLLPTPFRYLSDALPLAQELPDREPVLAACEGIHETYQRSGFGPAMAKFIALVSYEGPIPAGFADQPGPEPADFGLPTGDDGSRDDPLVGLNMPSTPGYQHDFDALHAAPTRIVVGVGAQSANMIAGRAGIAVAERLGTAPVTFPGGHNGFAGGEYGRTGEPDAFATTLRKVLTG